MADDDLEHTGAPSFDSARFREVLGHFCTGVTVVTTHTPGGPAGFTAQSFVSLSLEPPLVGVCPSASSTTLPRIREAGSFCVNVLSSEQEAVSRRFAGRSPDKFDGLGWSRGATGSPVIADVLCWVDCRVEAEHEAGDHVILVGRVVELGSGGRDARPLLFYRGGYGGFAV